MRFRPTKRRGGRAIRVLVASSEKIQRELNWRPQFAGLEKIIGSAWEWMRQHPRQYPAQLHNRFAGAAKRQAVA